MIEHDPEQAYAVHSYMLPEGKFETAQEMSTWAALSKALGGAFQTAAWLSGTQWLPRTTLRLLEARGADGEYLIKPCDALIFSDLDVLPLRPYSLLLDELQFIDFRLFYEPNVLWHNTHGPINSGFYLLRNRNTTRLLLSKWVSYITTYPKELHKKEEVDGTSDVGRGLVKRLFQIGNQLLLSRALWAPEVVASGLRWGDFRTPGGRHLLARAGPSGKHHPVGATNQSIALHACCTDNKTHAIHRVAACFARWPMACVEPRECERKILENPG